MQLIPEREILEACLLLFGEEVAIGRDFLFYLQPSGAKAAYRRRAKEFHPDRMVNAPEEIRRRGGERFRQLAEAHQLVHAFFRQRDAGIWRQGGEGGRGRSRPEPQAPARPNPAAGGGRCYRGEVPEIHLSIGRYCYYRGVIPYAVLIEAICWQRRQRPTIGEIARNWGWLNEEGIRRICSVRSGRLGLFGETAVELGLLAPKQVQSLLYYQRFRQQRLGRYFVERGYVTQEEIDRLAEELALHNARIAVRGRMAPRAS